jgi:hypothetical protein
LKKNDYIALCDQVRNREYQDCEITLGFEFHTQVNDRGPAPSRIDPRCIDSASVNFERKSPQPTDANIKPIKKGPFAYTKRWWAIVLIVMAAATPYFPQWNGIFFEPSKDIMTGEGRIIAAVMFVGGLLLWFLRET